MSGFGEVRNVRASKRLSVGIGGRIPYDRHGATLLPEQGEDWTDEQAEVKVCAKPVVRGRLSRINRRGICGSCYIKLQAVGGCQFCGE